MKSKINSITRDPAGAIVAADVFTKGDSNHFASLPQDIQEKTLIWIRKNFFPRKTSLPGVTSYGLKHRLQFRTMIYLTNNQFKEAMLICGFFPVRENEWSWWYHLSKKSPALNMQADRQHGLYLPECFIGERKDYPEVLRY